MSWNKNKYLDIIKNTQTIKEIGKITEIIGLTIESDGPRSSIGDLCYIYNDYNDKRQQILDLASKQCQTALF